MAFETTLHLTGLKVFGNTKICQTERVSAIKPGLIHHFLHLKMPVPSQEYDSSCPFVFDAFCYLILPCDYGLYELIFL